ncbi:MAG: hypothetical protein Q7S92_02665 [Candidatus Diapherotrites archaeon]|nr:hypothetical protein [Candidatus Diapherotrites archaeon]
MNRRLGRLRATKIKYAVHTQASSQLGKQTVPQLATAQLKEPSQGLINQIRSPPGESAYAHHTLRLGAVHELLRRAEQGKFQFDALDKIARAISEAAGKEKDYAQRLHLLSLVWEFQDIAKKSRK